MEDLKDAGGLDDRVMAHPTTAGVLASFASLGDVTSRSQVAASHSRAPRRAADDAGRASRRLRVAESNVRFGHLDAIVGRRDLRPYLGRFCACLKKWRVGELHLREPPEPSQELGLLRGAASRVSSPVATPTRADVETTDEEIWQHSSRETRGAAVHARLLSERIFDDFVVVELHGETGLALEDPR